MNGCVLFIIIATAIFFAVIALYVLYQIDQEAERRYGPEIHGVPRR